MQRHAKIWGVNEGRARLDPPLTPPSIQEPEKPQRNLVANADFHIVVCDETVGDVNRNFLFETLVLDFFVHIL